jgi:nitrogen-specific signal transduction histidine kinase
MLHEFLIANRREILGRSRGKLCVRKVPTPTESELVEGLPLFLEQMIAILRAEKGERTGGHESVATSAALHGESLLRIGLTVGQVVHDYGSICQSVTELADERNVSITAEDFHTFNRCLDDAIAQAVTSYEHQRDQTISAGPGIVQFGFLAHEMRNLLTTSMLTYDALVRGDVGVGGSTGTLLGRSLRRMRALVDRTLAEVRLEAGTQQAERVIIAELIQEIEVVATIEANDRDVQLSIDVGAYDVAVQADHQILVSAVANIVQNAFKFTRPHGHIKVRARTTGERVLIDVEDECGGLPPGQSQDLFRPFEQRGVDKTGMGLGLSISLKGVQASGGEIHVLDRPGVGCMFTIDLPRAASLP